MTRAAAAALLLALAGCGATSDVAVLSPGVFGLTARSATLSGAVSRGIGAAERHCAASRQVMAPVRTEIGQADYKIAFRCVGPNEPPAP